MPAAAADELAVDALRFVQLGADDVQPAEFVHAFAEANVGAAAGHVRRDGDFAVLAGVRDDFRFLGNVPRVEHRVLDAALVEQPRQDLALVDRARADEHRPAERVLLEQGRR